MKEQVRILGVDDAPFGFDDQYTLVVGVLMRLPNYLEGVLRTRVEVDGTDAADRLTELILNSRYREQMKLVLLDGICLGGFNVLDIHRIHDETNVPVATVTRKKPDMNSIKKALRKNFQDWELRLELVRKNKLERVGTKHSPIFVTAVGIEIGELKKVLALSTVRGVLPEPLRVAHLIATGITVGESYGRA